MITLPGIASLTQEQKEILETCPSAEDHCGKGKLVRITAAAGAGKTTTLLALALRAILEQGHTHLTYVTFTKAAAADGKERLDRALASCNNRCNIDKTGKQAKAAFIDARTLHSAAHQLLNYHLAGAENGSNKIWTDKKIKNWISKECAYEIESFLRPCFKQISKKDPKHRDAFERRAREQVEFFIFKSLNHFCTKEWSLETYMSGDVWGRDYYPAKLFHEPKGKGEQYGFPCHLYQRKIAFYAEQAAQLFQLVMEKDIRSYNFEMKRAQLLNLQVKGTLLLVDESQDMDACQVDWITRQQVRFGTHVYVVGDPAQSIYGFRGAKPEYLMDLNSDADRMLTDSWRFGKEISDFANLILYAKKKSEQTSYDRRTGKPKNWMPYRTRTGLPEKFARVTTKTILSEWKTKKVTLIARTNATLLIEALDLLGFVFCQNEESDSISEEAAIVNEETGDGNNSTPVVSLSPDWDADYEDITSDQQDDQSLPVNFLPEDLPKIHINGRGENSGLRQWKQVLKVVENVYELYRLHREGNQGGIKLDKTLFPDFIGKSVTWNSFCDEVEQKELAQKYSQSIHVVTLCRDKTLEAMELFRARVVDQRFSANEANIILTTAHSSKGMEWDNVQVCNDMIDFNTFKCTGGNSLPSSPHGSPWKRLRVSKTYQFGFKSWGDDVNLAYVACTRAKNELSVPPRIFEVINTFDVIHEWLHCVGMSEKSPSTPERDFITIPGIKEQLQKDTDKLGESERAPNKMNQNFITIPGFKDPLHRNEAEDFYKSIVLPLRNEYCLTSEQTSLKQFLLETDGDDSVPEHVDEVKSAG